MIESLFAWILTFVAITRDFEADYYIAAAIFAVAAQISKMRDRK